MNKSEIIYLYTDGACSGNPGPGGYGIVMKCGNLRKEISQGFINTTNNRMELRAVITALESIKWEKANVIVVSDSSYVVNAINKQWLELWEKNNFKNNTIKNRDLWEKLIIMLKRHNVRFEWIKGHAGHSENETCDRLAVAKSKGDRSELMEDEGFTG